nr:immunoglobulin light chain junction region [Macaca mulatta]MOV96317.1 immunoglobulin light chain junction region [Macaca mulatta]
DYYCCSYTSGTTFIF